MAWAAVALGSGLVRLALLDRAPLAESEALYAFAAWQAGQGRLGSSLAETGAPFLTHLMAGLFWLFGTSDVAARLPSALAGVGLALSPALLSGPLGPKVALLAGVLIGASPVAVQVSRVIDPASITAALAMLVVASAIRLFTDAPRWAPWSLAAGVGLSLVHDPGMVVALGSAGIAALSTWAVSPRELVDRLRVLGAKEGRGPLAVGAAVAVIGATAGLMDLGGMALPLGRLWGEVPGLLAPAPFPPRNLAALLAYAGPLLALAAAGLLLAVRQKDRLALFLGQWALFLIVLAAAFGASVLTFAILAIAPLALLGGIALSRAPATLDAYRLSAGAWGAVALSLVALTGSLVVFAHAVGISRPATPVTLLALLGIFALALAAWRRDVPERERGPAQWMLGAILWAAFTAGTIGRVSYGGSPPGTELLAREETHPALRAVFRELNVLASADPTRIMVFDAETPLVVRWYGRAIPQVPRTEAVPRRAMLFQEAPPPDSASLAGTSGRTPWKTISRLNHADLHLLGMGRWAVSRIGLVEGRPRDIIITG